MARQREETSFLKWKDAFSKVKCFDKFVLISLVINICSVFGKMAEDWLTGLSRVCRAEGERERGCASEDSAPSRPSPLQERRDVSGHVPFEADQRRALMGINRPFDQLNIKTVSLLNYFLLRAAQR